MAGEELDDRPVPDQLGDQLVAVEGVPGRWVDAGDLRFGDVLVSRGGGQSTVESVETEQVQTTVYHIYVEDLHNYSVGNGEWLVHNGHGDDLPLQSHHFATNKNKNYTPQMKSIADGYGLKLNGNWNKEVLPHLGRHPNDYHDFVLKGMRQAARGAGPDQTKFLDLYEKLVKAPVRQNPDMLRKFGWQ